MLTLPHRHRHRTCHDAAAALCRHSRPRSSSSHPLDHSRRHHRTGRCPPLQPPAIKGYQYRSCCCCRRCCCVCVCARGCGRVCPQAHTRDGVYRVYSADIPSWAAFSFAVAALTFLSCVYITCSCTCICLPNIQTRGPRFRSCFRVVFTTGFFGCLGG